MDPNACLDRFIGCLNHVDLDEAADARADLLSWLRNGGFEPMWEAHPGWSRKRFEEWRHPGVLTLDQLQTCALSLENHARYCDRMAVKSWEQQSSDLSYEHNVHCTSQAARYRAQAKDCNDTLKQVRTIMEALRFD